LWKKIVIYNPEDNNGSLMKSIRIAERAMKKYRRDGVIPLTRSTPSYMTNRLSEYISIRRGKLSKKIAGRKIIINVDSYAEIKALNHAKATENDMINDLVTEASDGDTIYDIGAHIGIHSCLLGISNTQSDIISFEPFPSNTVQYLKNTEINGVDSTLVPIALSDSTDLLSMTGDSNSTSTGAPSLDPDASKQNIHVV
jgi:hypothetical protein